MLELDEIGKRQLEILIKQATDLNILMPGDEKILLTEAARAYQYYIEFLELSLNLEQDPKDQSRFHMQSSRWLKAYYDALKQASLGSALQRKKIQAQEQEEIKNTIMDKVQQYLSEPDYIDVEIQ